jgi:hypothetical protein
MNFGWTANERRVPASTPLALARLGVKSRVFFLITLKIISDPSGVLYVKPMSPCSMGAVRRPLSISPTLVGSGSHCLDDIRGAPSVVASIYHTNVVYEVSTPVLLFLTLATSQCDGRNSNVKDRP